MKLALFILTSLFAFSVGYSQEYVYDSHGQIVSGPRITSMPPKVESLYDSINNVKYCLDSSHIYITSISFNGDTLWRKDPWKEIGLAPYRMKRPFIVYFAFEKLDKSTAKYYHLKKNQKVISIIYRNSQFGIITLSDGYFYFEGQD